MSYTYIKYRTILSMISKIQWESGLCTAVIISYLLHYPCFSSSFVGITSYTYKRSHSHELNHSSESRQLRLSL